jgi:hypothetical protein
MAKRRSSVISVLITGDNRELASTLDDSSSRLGAFGKAAGAALLAAGVAFGSFAKSALTAAMETEAAQARLATILRNTGLASEEQIVSLNRQAAALEKVGVASGSNITVLQAQLATFDLSAKAIETLTPAVLDYVIAEKGATAVAGDFQAAANGLASALQGNFGALSRVGFVLDDTTKEMIKNGTEAQRVAALVEVLGSTYDGFNEKARETAAGALQALKNQFDAVKESVGNQLLPFLHQLLAWFTKNQPTIEAFADRALKALASGIELVADMFEKVRPKIASAIGFIRDRLEEFRTFWDANLREPVEEARERIGRFVDSVKERMAEFKAAIPGAVKSLTDFFAEIRKLTDNPEALGLNLGLALRRAILTAFEEIKQLSGKVNETIRELMGRVEWGRIGRESSTFMLQFATGFAAGLISLDWIGPVLRVLADNWQAVLIGALSIAFSGPAVIGRLTALLARIPIVGKLLAWFVTKLNAVFEPLKKWIGTRVSLIVGEFVSKFLLAIRGGGPPLIQGFVNFLLFIPRAVIRAFDDAVLNVALGFGRFGTALGTSIRAFAGKASELLGFLLTPFRSFGKMLGDDLFLVGQNAIGALIRGLRSMGTRLFDVVRSIGRSVWDTLSKLWKISSPSKVFMSLGKDVGFGLALGIESTERMIRDAALIAGGAASADAMVSGIRGGSRGAAPINVTVNGAIDAEGTARQVLRVLQDAQRRTGVQL